MERPPTRRPMTQEQKDKARAAEYETGFGKPPAATRFQKGQSGNPGGRPRDPSLKTLLKRQLDEMVEYRENGVRNRASKKAILVARVFAEGLSGGVRERQQLLDLITRVFPEEFQDEPSTALSKDRQSILKRLMTRLGEGQVADPSEVVDDDDEPP